MSDKKQAQLYEHTHKILSMHAAQTDSFMIDILDYAVRSYVKQRTKSLELKKLCSYSAKTRKPQSS